jgi:hypothetical protein
MSKQRKKTTQKGRQWTISRRRFLEGVIVASGATGVGLAAIAGRAPSGTAAASNGSSIGFRVFTQEQGDLLTVLLNRIVPADGNMPAAGDIGVGRYIDGVLADAPHLRRPILDVITEVQAAAAAAPLSGDQLDHVLGAIEQRQKTSFDVLLQATYTGYYSHPQVLNAIGWTESGAHAEAFDVALLDSVKERGPIYKTV